MAKKKKAKKKAPDSGPNLDLISQQIDKFLEADLDESKASAGTDPLKQGEAPPPVLEPSGEGADPEAESASIDGEAGEGELPEIAEEGDAPPTALELVVSDDELFATLVAVYPTTTVEEIQALLSENGITEGIAEGRIQQSVQTAGQEEKALNDVVLAEGTPPQPPPPARLEHSPPEGLSALPPLDPVKKAIGMEDRKELTKSGASTKVWTVEPGRSLARKIIQDGKPGVGVRGTPVPASAQTGDDTNTQLIPGEGVELDETGDEYLARIYGCAGILDGRVTVLSPLWMTPDQMVACVLELPRIEGSALPSLDDIQSALADAGIDEGILEDRIITYCEEIAAGKKVKFLVPVAAGTKPIESEDAAVEMQFPAQAAAGQIRPDGSIDFKERNAYPTVEVDMVLAESRPGIPGTPGKTLLGEEIPVDTPAAAELIAGEGVRLEGEADAQKIIATVEGGASAQIAEATTPEGTVRRYTIAVRPIAQIPEDVGYETGNIDFKGNVEIKGSVKAGFRVTATGDINIGGSVEDGGNLDAGGDIKVQLGIAGEKTTAEARGNIMAKFIQEADVKAGGDVVVGSYIHGARVYAGNNVKVEGSGGSGGGIIGGEVWGLNNITTKNAGSDRTSNTLLVAGVDPELHSRMTRLSDSASQAETLLGNLHQSLQLETLDAEEVRKVVARMPSKKDLILQSVKKAQQLEGLRAKHVENLKAIQSEIAETSSKATIVVSERAYARISLRIGTEHSQLQDDLVAASFHIDGTGELRGVLVDAAASEGKEDGGEEPSEEADAEDAGTETETKSE